jgi:PGF-CTERM protein
MDSYRVLAGGALLVLVVAALSAGLVPGALADPSAEGPLRPGPVRVVEAPVSHGSVTGQQAELTLHTVLRHDGNPTRNVTVRFRAIDSDSGLLVAERTVDVGTLSGESETQVDGTLTVAREGGYRLEAVVYRNGGRVDTFSREVRGMEALTPEYASSNVSFVEDPVLQPLSVAVADVSANRTSLSLGAWLTATGPNGADDLTVTFVVRQAESNLVAGRQSVSTSSLDEGRTEMVETTLSVPSGYNYYVDAILTRDGVVVDTAAGVVNLDPQRTLERNETREDVEFDVGDFDTGGGTDGGRQEGTPATAEDSPGFGPLVAILALLSTGLLVRRRRR